MTHQQAIDTLASERYLLDEMSEPERFAFEAHFFSCRECADDVRTGEHMRQRVKSALAHDGEPQATVATMIGRRQARWRPQVVLPWACAATVTLLFGYESLMVVPELRKAAAPQALAPVVLRPTSRGIDPVVELIGDRPFAALAIDVNASPAGQTLAYEITAGAGSSVASGTAPLPPAGTPLLLMIPSRQLASGAHYRLVVRDPAATSTILGEYGFVVR